MENKASSKDCFVEYVKWLFHYLVLWHVCRITYPHQISVIPDYPHLNVHLALIELAKFLSLSEMATSAFRLVLIPIHRKIDLVHFCWSGAPPIFRYMFPNSLSYSNDSFRISHAMNGLSFLVANSARRVCSGISLVWHYKVWFDQTELTSTLHNY